MNRRTLALRREILTELTDADLGGLTAGQGSETCASCLTYVSCYMTDCIKDFTLARCIEPDPNPTIGC